VAIRKSTRAGAYLLTIYKYQLTFFYGITNCLYNSLHALSTVAPATVAQPTLIQQSTLLLTGATAALTLNAL
jgi:hypothetical protein